jgi:hypothetical protein
VFSRFDLTEERRIPAKQAGGRNRERVVAALEQLQTRTINYPDLLALLLADSFINMGTGNKGDGKVSGKGEPRLRALDPIRRKLFTAFVPLRQAPRLWYSINRIGSALGRVYCPVNLFGWE